MARTFVAASSQNLESSSAAVTGAPLTLACWVNLNSMPGSGSQENILTLEDSAANTGDQFALLIYNNGTNTQVYASTYQSSGGLDGNAISSASLSTGTWLHCAGVFSSASSRACYVNGDNVGTDSTTATPAGINATLIGAQWDGGSGPSLNNFFDGKVAEAAIWNVALTANEIAALAAGVLPFAIRPANLVGYWPLWGFSGTNPEPDLSGNANNLTVTGATQDNHAPVTLFTPKARTIGAWVDPPLNFSPAQALIGSYAFIASALANKVSPSPALLSSFAPAPTDVLTGTWSGVHALLASYQAAPTVTTSGGGSLTFQAQAALVGSLQVGIAPSAALNEAPVPALLGCYQEAPTDVLTGTWTPASALLGSFQAAPAVTTPGALTFQATAALAGSLQTGVTPSALPAIVSGGGGGIVPLLFPPRREERRHDLRVDILVMLSAECACAPSVDNTALFTEIVKFDEMLVSPPRTPSPRPRVSPAPRQPPPRPRNRPRQPRTPPPPPLRVAESWTGRMVCRVRSQGQAQDRLAALIAQEDEMLLAGKIPVRAERFVQAKRPVSRFAEADRLLEVPDVPQPHGYECGAACAMSAARFFGVGPTDLRAWVKLLGTDPDNGTAPKAIARVLRQLGLRVEARQHMTLADLRDCWRAGKPVICPIQDYSLDAGPGDYEDGHYVVSIGVALGYVFVQDPMADVELEDAHSAAAPGRVIIPEQRFLQRWHDRSAAGRYYLRYGIVVGPPI